ncbi:MAG: site-2 protease family protein [Chloroflexi bacterium]|nr:site-2 protease family protein [Chloroflexota bacterium]
MLFQLLNSGLPVRDRAILFLTMVLGILVAITIHEFSHALTASYLGDGTAKRLGRISLNPLRHLDPLGTVFLLLAGFGWGKPVPVDVYNLRGGMAKAMAKVSFAGPLSNLVLAAIIAIGVRLLPVRFVFNGPDVLDEFLGSLIGTLVTINIILAVFNMLPIAPMDGFKVAVGILPRDLAISLARTEQYGMAILMLLVVADQFFGIGFLGWILGPLVHGVSKLLLGAYWSWLLLGF